MGNSVFLFYTFFILAQTPSPPPYFLDYVLGWFYKNLSVKTKNHTLHRRVKKMT